MLLLLPLDFSDSGFLTQVVAEMAAIGFGLEKDAFTALMKEVKSNGVQLQCFCLLTLK